MSILEVRNLSVQYHTGQESRQALDGISFSVGEGETVGIVGESGSGKSTAMLAVMGLLGDSAEVSSDGITVCERPVQPGRDIAMILQDSLNCLNPAVKIGRQITETVRIHRKCTRREAKERAEELLDMAGIRSPKLRMGQYPFELSGGMRQRVAIAIALACEPRVIIADEPTTALDAAVQVQILHLLKRIVEDTGTSLLVVSHDMGVIAALCSRVYVMKAGRIIEAGSAEEIFYAPVHEYTKKLLRDTKGHKPIPTYPQEAHWQEEHLRGDHLQGLHLREKPQPPLLRLEHVTKVFGTDEGIRDISMEIRAGEVYALAGESGSGKTTLARLLTGLLTPDEGKILYRGECLDAGKGKQVWNGKIQMVFQDAYGSLNPCLTVGQALSEALRAQGGKDGLTPAERRRRVEEMLCMAGLSPEDADRYPDEFSGGERQRIGIARALIPEPELLICDEAFSALDASTRKQVLDLLLPIQKEKKIACLFISHDLALIRQVSSRISVLLRGRLAESGETKDICQDPWHPYTKMLLNSVLPPDPLKAGKVRPVFAEEGTQGIDSGKGCPFAASCGYAMKCCFEETPGSYRFGSRETACFLYSEKHTGKRAEGYTMTSQI